MKVLNIEEQPDGSAIVQIDMSKDEVNYFIEYAVLDILKKGLEAHEDNFRTPVSE